MSLRSDFPNIDFYSHRQSDLAIIESLPILRGSTSCELAVNIWEVEPRGTSDLPNISRALAKTLLLRALL